MTTEQKQQQLYAELVEKIRTGELTLGGVVDELNKRLNN